MEVGSRLDGCWPDSRLASQGPCQRDDSADESSGIFPAGLAHAGAVEEGRGVSVAGERGLNGVDFTQQLGEFLLERRRPSEAFFAKRAQLRGEIQNRVTRVVLGIGGPAGEASQNFRRDVGHGAYRSNTTDL